MRARAIAVLLVVGTALLALLAPGAGAAHAARYVVQLTADPLSRYDGGVAGLRPTSPSATGRRLERDAPRVRAYRGHLARRQAAVLDRLPGPRVTPSHAYRFAFAGFAADLTAQQREALDRDPAVARVWRDAAQPLSQAPPPTPEAVQAALGGRTGDGAAYLGLPTGLWQRLGGVHRAGEGVIVGVVDTGIVPEHPSFAADLPDAPRFEAPEVWDGACEGGDGFPTSACNEKLIGARYFVAGYGVENLDPTSFVSPRDDDGHGSHTAGTAAGNFGVDPVVAGEDLGVDRISGIAPRAHVAAYKACWAGSQGVGSCFFSDTTAAIDAAVADGVDVISYSIGDLDLALTPTGIAFLGAADAGVFVAASAGNAGPGPTTVEHNAPWVTSVGASSLARTFSATVTVTGGPDGDLSVTGASESPALPSAPLVDAEDAAAEGASADDAALCLAGALDPAAVRGAVVLCRRGPRRVAKSRVVQEAGGVGVILHNTRPDQSLLADPSWIPMVLVSAQDGARIKAAIGPGTRAAFSAGRATPQRGAVMTDFSSRGPQGAVPDVLKPDVTAPGLNILAATTPDPTEISNLRPGELFQAISGTSMSAPHVAGAGALLTQANPLLSPAELKSSLMTTASTDVLLQDGRTPATPLDAGAGEIDPNRAAQPGLVLDAGTTEFLRYLEGLDPELVQGDIPPLAATDLNLASIADGDLAGTLATTRTFRSVDPTARRWTVAVEGVPGFAVTASPRRFTIRPGQEVEVDVEARRTGAPFEQYAFGALVLRSAGRTVRLPMALRPVALAVPESLTVDAAAAQGSAPLTVTSGYTGRLAAVGWGLAAPSTRAGETITTTTGTPVLTGEDPGTDLFPVTVPEGAQVLAGETADADGGAPGTDLDLFLFRDPNADGDLADAVLVGQEADEDANERVVVALPEAGAYVFAVVGFSTRDPQTTYAMRTWLADDPAPDDPQPAPGLVVGGEPPLVGTGEEVPLTATWSGVVAPGTYLGLATFHDEASPTAANRRGATLVEVRRR